jgi:polar amino acid transport system substrate-binding protein
MNTVVALYRACANSIGVFWLCLGLAGLSHPVHADALARIKASGTLVVGVKKDVPLWGFWDADSAQIRGLEPDLARRVADHLGVKLKLVGVLTSERDEAVVSGRVDLLIATLSDTSERRQTMTLVLPHYYASGVNLLSRKAEGFQAWSELRHRRVCGRRGAFYNRLITVSYGIDLIALYGNDLSFAALRDGRCSAVLHDDIAIAVMLQNPTWNREFEMPLPTLYTVPWSIALAPQERAGALEKTLSNLVVSWHRQGVLQKLEASWGIPATDYLKDKHEIWQRKVNGVWFCGNEINTRTPQECL